MYCINGNSSWYSDCGPLFGGCPLLGVSVIGGSTVCDHPRARNWVQCEQMVFHCVCQNVTPFIAICLA